MHKIPKWVVAVYCIYTLVLAVISVIVWVRLSKPNAYTIEAAFFDYDDVIVNEYSRVSMTDSVLLTNTSAGAFFIAMAITAFLGILPMLLYVILWVSAPQLLDDGTAGDHTNVVHHEVKHAIDSHGNPILIV